MDDHVPEPLDALASVFRSAGESGSVFWMIRATSSGRTRRSRVVKSELVASEDIGHSDRRGYIAAVPFIRAAAPRDVHSEKSSKNLLLSKIVLFQPNTSRCAAHRATTHAIPPHAARRSLARAGAIIAMRTLSRLLHGPTLPRRVTQRAWYVASFRSSAQPYSMRIGLRVAASR